ncbi:MAG: hypothetical protein SF051_00095 [Elusimicrobiota bacterium]|nr:hypothetical protein [Elusimicrobiota bacterium]
MTRPTRWALGAAGLQAAWLVMLWAVSVFLLPPDSTPGWYALLMLPAILPSALAGFLLPDTGQDGLLLPVLIMLFSLLFWGACGWTAGKAADWRRRGA